MAQINNEGLHLPYFRLVLGVLALLVELYFSILFLGQGVSGAAFVGAIAFAVITDAVKVMFAGDVTYYRTIGKNDNAFAAFMIVAVLMGLSVFASYWYLASNPLKAEVGLENNAKHVEQLKSNVAAKEAALSACNPSHVTKCVTPRTAELTKMQTALSEAMKKQDAFNDAAASKLFWEKTAASVGSTPDNLRQGFALFRSVILELLGVVLCGQFFGNNRLKHYQVIQSEEKPKEVTPPENVIKLPEKKQQAHQ